jgi:hypothetical protein
VALEVTQCLPLRLALGDVAIEVGPTRRVGLVDLADRHYVDGVVEATMTPQREPMEQPTSRGLLYWSDPCIGGEAVPLRETSEVAAVTDHRAGEDRSDTEDVVSVVFDARTAERMRRCDSLICSSRRATSSTSSRASWWRMCSMGVAGSKEPRSRLASET